MTPRGQIRNSSYFYKEKPWLMSLFKCSSVDNVQFTLQIHLMGRIGPSGGRVLAHEPYFWHPCSKLRVIAADSFHLSIIKD